MAVHDEICGAIDHFKDEAVGLGRQIHARPELKFEEHFACDLLSGALGKVGIEVERGVGGLKTAFRATVGGRALQSRSLPNTTRCPTATPAATT
jgi:metal-dependent amidase/aminoacylase/carboxypeptidase family protein